MLAPRRLYRPLGIAPRLYWTPHVLRYSTGRQGGSNVTGPGGGSISGQDTPKPEKTQVEADKIVKEYLHSIKPEFNAQSRDGPTKPIETVASPKPESPGPKVVPKTDPPTPKPVLKSSVSAPAPSSRDVPAKSAATAVTSKPENPNPVSQTDSHISPKSIDISQTQFSEKLPSDVKKASQSLAMWKDATLSLLRSRGADAATQLNALGGKLNKVTGYDEIEALKRKVVEREQTIAALRAAARKAKEDYTEAVSTRASRQRQVNDLLQRKSTWTDNDVIAFTKLVREDHASATAELEAKSNLEQAEAAVDVEFGRLMRAILDRYHEEQVWSDKIRSVSTYGSLAALVANIVVFVLAIVVVEPWKRKRLAQTFENRITEMSEETRRLVEGGMKGLEEHFEKQEGVLVALADVAKGPILIERKEEPLPPVEPTEETPPIPSIPSLSPLTQPGLLDKAKVLIDSLTPSTDRDYALMAVTLASLVRQPNTAPIKAGGRPSTAPHALLDDRRKPRLSLKVVPSLPRPVTSGGPRAVTIHPPTPGILGVPSTGTTGQQPPSVYFSPRNPVSSPELSPPSFTPGPTLEDENSPPSPNTQLETMSVSSRSTVALGYSQPQSHTTSPTFSAGASPPSRPFSPTSLPPPPESQPLFTPSSEHSMLFADFASTTPSATAAPPSPYATRLPAAATRSPPPLVTARSPPLSSSLTSYEASISNPDPSILESDTALSQSHSPLLSLTEFIQEPEPESNPPLKIPSPPPPVFSHRPTGVAYVYDTIDAQGMAGKRSGSREKHSLEEEFRLVSFAQGCVLDEHSTVADLRIRPGELLEIQRKNSMVHLARSTYTQPFFEAPIYVRKQTVSTSSQQRSHSSHYQSRPHNQPFRDYPSSHRTPPVPPIQTVESRFPPLLLPTSPIESISTSSSSTRMRSGTITAHGPSQSDPDLDDGHDYTELDMSGLEGVGGGAPLPTGGSGGTSSGWGEGVVRPPDEKFEWKLRWLVLREGKLSISRSKEKQSQPLFTRPLSTLLSAQQSPAVPHIGSISRNYIRVEFSGSSRRDRGEREREIGIRTMDGAIHVHLLRILLRNSPGAHTWLPTDTPIIASAPLSSQYPEWRQYIVQRAWLAGRGTSIMRGSAVAGPWMRPPWVAWTDKEAELFVQPSPSESDADYESDSSDDQPLFFQTRDSDSEIEWDNEAWRAWESENAFGNWSSSNNSWLRLGSRMDMGRPRSRSLAAPSIQQPSTHPPQETILSPASTSSELSITSPNTRRARSSTIGPDSPGNSGSPQAWARTGAGIETVLRAPASSEAISTAGSRRASNQSRGVPGERRGSATSLEMQRAMPSRRAVTTPAQGSAGKCA
ncbi:unnamed protein product [Rhizoctonia solani]|uniref:Sensitive to high expression protein 9, mitochondrial n=1 Tax=Rhizoctonia solani TaxID=456999 RepID=A0A8H3BG58_9AGAM|nr:unnamed protein product [Rhizoctonia solani]